MNENNDFERCPKCEAVIPRSANFCPICFHSLRGNGQGGNNRNEDLNRKGKLIAWIKKLSLIQTIIVAVIFPILLLVIALAWAASIRGGIEDTWGIWLFFFLIVGIFEFRFFGIRKNER